MPYIAKNIPKYTFLHYAGSVKIGLSLQEVFAGLQVYSVGSVANRSAIAGSVYWSTGLQDQVSCNYFQLVFQQTPSGVGCLHVVIMYPQHVYTQCFHNNKLLSYNGI